MGHAEKGVFDVLFIYLVIIIVVFVVIIGFYLPKLESLWTRTESSC